MSTSILQNPMLTINSLKINMSKLICKRLCQFHQKKPHLKINSLKPMSTINSPKTYVDVNFAKNYVNSKLQKEYFKINSIKTYVQH
jgi:hypothetical protein